MCPDCIRFNFGSLSAIVLALVLVSSVDPCCCCRCCCSFCRCLKLLSLAVSAAERSGVAGSGLKLSLTMSPGISTPGIVCHIRRLFRSMTLPPKIRPKWLDIWCGMLLGQIYIHRHRPALFEANKFPSWDNEKRQILHLRTVDQTALHRCRIHVLRRYQKEQHLSSDMGYRMTGKKDAADKKTTPSCASCGDYRVPARLCARRPSYP